MVCGGARKATLSRWSALPQVRCLVPQLSAGKATFFSGRPSAVAVSPISHSWLVLRDLCERRRRKAPFCRVCVTQDSSARRESSGAAREGGAGFGRRTDPGKGGRTEDAPLVDVPYGM